MVVALFVAAVAPVAEMHLSRLPGRFEGTFTTAKALRAGAGGCDLAFRLGSHRYNLTDLQVSVGGYVADNSIDKFS